MDSLETIAHQLFSSTFVHMRKKEAISFENLQLPAGLGPIAFETSDQQEDQIILDGSAGILGHHSSLILKSRLKAFFDGRFIASQENLRDLIFAIEIFLEKTTGLKIFVSPDPSLSFDYSCGFYPHFLGEKAKERLTKGESLRFPAVFTDYFTFSLTPSSSQKLLDQALPLSLYYEIRDLIRFLEQGQFYGHKHLIAHKQNQLNQVFQSSGISFDGLVGQSDKSIKNNATLKTRESILLFPLLFDDGILEECKTSIEKNLCSS